MFKLLKLRKNPTLINKIIIFNNTVSHKYNFRLVTDFKIPLHRKNIGQRALLFKDLNYRYLPGNLKVITSLYLFKKHSRLLFECLLN